MDKIQYLQEKIDKLLNIGTSLSQKRKLDEILEGIIDETRYFTNADGGTLYLKTKDEKNLRFVIAQNKTLNIRMGGTSGKIEWPLLPLYLEDNQENLNMVATLSVLKNQTINIKDAYATGEFDLSGTKKFDKQTGYRSKSMLIVPMRDNEGLPIGALQLLNKLDKNNNPIDFTKDDEKIILSLASQAAVTITNTLLIGDLEHLLEAFLKTIAMAIDEKSKYTGGHVRKVVEISEMLSNAINEDETIFKDTHFSQDRLKEIKLSALMHDIGKITTPEYVVDKATKLSTIYDRIGLIKMRFEFLKKDAKIELLEQKLQLSNVGDLEQLNKLEMIYEGKIKQFDEDLKSLQQTNLGAEWTDDKTIQKIKEIGANKIKIDGTSQDLLSENEIQNLSIQKGTLLDNEREIINKHAKVGLDMLTSLPFPKKYQDIPYIAGAHHEKLDGTGYPLGLKADEISIEARILSVADIFEALTASDRPYKKGMNLSQAMKILYFMAKDNHLDVDIVRFFYDKKLYLEYAKKEMKEEYIDEVKISFDDLVGKKG